MAYYSRLGWSTTLGSCCGSDYFQIILHDHQQGTIIIATAGFKRAKQITIKAHKTVFYY